MTSGLGEGGKTRGGGRRPTVEKESEWRHPLLAEAPTLCDPPPPGSRFSNVGEDECGSDGFETAVVFRLRRHAQLAIIA